MLQTITNIYAKLTGTTRYRPEIKWSKYWTSNIFRFYELIFGRKYGVRREISAVRVNGKVYHYCHTIESVLTFAEIKVREFFSSFKLVPVRIYIPQLSPVGLPPISSPYLFAIAFDSGLDAQSVNNYSFTNTAGDFLVVAIRTASGETVTGITYNSAALTNNTQVTFDPGDRILYMWSKKSPSTGSNTVSITGPTFYRDLYTASYSGCDTTTNPGNTGTNTGSGTSLSVSLTTNAAGDWLAAAGRDDSGNLASGTNWTPRGAATSIQYGDSNASVGTGSQTVQITGVSGNLYMCAMVIRAAAASGPANMKSLDGNAIANIKSIDGNLIANVKSFDGNS